MATALTGRRGALLGCLVALSLGVGCSTPWSSARTPIVTAVAVLPPSPTAAVTPTGQSVTQQPAATPLGTSATAQPTRRLTTTATVIGSPVANAAPTPFGTSMPAITQGAVSSCCGIFAWVSGGTLLVYDAPQDGQAGSYVTDAKTGSRQYLAPHFGLPSAGLVAISRPDAGQTEVLRLDGSVVASIKNGGTTTWLSPDGTRAAWLERLSASTPSSLLPRPVRLWTAGVDGSNAQALHDLLATSLVWLPDNRHLLLIAREIDGTRPGVWLVDTMTGSIQLLAAAAFPQALQVSPDGASFAYLATFSGQADQDGVWVQRIDGGQRTRLSGAGGFRWSVDSRTLWRLEPGTAGAPDRLVDVDPATGTTLRQLDLRAQVRTDVWELSPDGHSVAYWRDHDGAVVLEALPA